MIQNADFSDKKIETPAVDLTGFDLVTQHLVMSEHLNPNHTIFGGVLLAWLDTDVYLYTANKVRYRTMVTLTMTNVYFRTPAFLGDHVRIYSRIKDIRRSSITALGKAVAHDPETQNEREVIECEITYVAVDKSGKPQRIFQKEDSERPAE